jgi:octaprenyl-diphosphate synthase
MLSNALISATKTNSLPVMKAVSNIGMELSDGELLQLTNTQQTKITEEDYFKVIRKKTALLFATCTVVGAFAAGASESNVRKLRNFGEYLGICFQIKDDIFDYYSNIEIGKPTANDLRDGKVTLPLIYALKNTTGEIREKCLAIIDSKDFTDEHVELIMNFAKENGGVDYANKCMEAYKNKAIAELNNFADSDVKEALIMCAEFAAGRNI